MSFPKSLLLAGASLVVMVVGAVGPWAKVLIFTIDGTDDGKDGWIVIGAAAVALLVLIIVAVSRLRWLALIALLAGAAGAATAAYDISDINSVGNSQIASAQWGIYLALGGSIALILSAIALIAEVRRPVRPASPVSEPVEPIPPGPSA